MTGKNSESDKVDRLIRFSILIGAIAVGLWVANTYVGTYPPIEHCPDSEFSCPSQNIRNVIPGLVGGIVAIIVGAPSLYAYDRLATTESAEKI